MKPTLSLISALAIAALLSGCSRSATPAPATSPEAKPAEEEAGPKVTRDSQGNAVITMTDELQGNIGIQVTNPIPHQMNPEVKAYGRVLDPAPLAALLNELAAARAAFSASSNELARLKTLAGQGNASARALQTAEANSLHDQLAVQSAKDRLSLSWGKAVGDQIARPEFTQLLTSLEIVLVRLELPLDQSLKSAPLGARLTTLAGDANEAEFLGNAPAVDPQMQGLGLFFLVKTNTSRLLVGQALTGFIRLPGEPVTGVLVPRGAVVRTEGSGWVYVLDNKGAEAFTRTEIALDHPTPLGWFVTQGIKAGDYIVSNGAQQLLSIELKGAGGE
jgi:hypothetical protein